jgi:hypothetical protein
MGFSHCYLYAIGGNYQKKVEKITIFPLIHDEPPGFNCRPSVPVLFPPTSSDEKTQQFAPYLEPWVEYYILCVTQFQNI